VVSIKSWRALGTSVHVITTHPKGLEPAAAAVEKLLTRVDLTYSRFRPDSELTYLNSHAGKPVQLAAQHGDRCRHAGCPHDQRCR